MKEEIYKQVLTWFFPGNYLKKENLKISWLNLRLISKIDKKISLKNPVKYSKSEIYPY